jgi:P pilus assembly chaperone PapD
MSRQLLWAVLLSLGLLQNSFAAAKLQIWPTHVYISKDQPIATVNLRNLGNTAVNLQGTAYAWEMDEQGKTTLTDIDGFVFYPKMLTIEANEQKTLNVGYDGDFPALEKPYRLKIRELPQLKNAQQTQTAESSLGIKPLLELSVPLFVRSTRRDLSPKASVETPSQTATGVRVGIRNHGQQNFLLRGVNLSWLDAAGKTQFAQQHEHAIRVLPQRRLRQDIAIPTLSCGNASKLDVELVLEQPFEPITHTFALSPGQCLP